MTSPANLAGLVCTLDAVNQYILNRNKQEFGWIIILVFKILGANELILVKLSKKNKL